MLQELDYLPDGLLELEAHELEGVLDGPTLIHLTGAREPALFVSVLMHGNEPTGWEAVRQLLSAYGAEGQYESLPRSVSLFIGNVSAASQGLRRLDGQPDYNRVWPGCEVASGAEHEMMGRVVEIMTRRGMFASVDIHNNTGLNPHYACVNVIDNRFLHLAAMFSRTVVYFIRPCGVQSLAMSKHCPAVTLECGRPGQAHGVEHAREYLDACLHLSDFPEPPVSEHDIDLFHTVAVVKVPEDISFGFGGVDAQLQFDEDLELFNFRELTRGTRLGRSSLEKGLGLDARDEQGRDVTSRYFEVDGSDLRLRVPVMPSMLTRDERVIRQDCLCYLMERYDDHLRDGDSA
ncbi:M14 family metallopeptidase [Solemya velesiana gill symbiont]|uniref:Peptidase M14 n=1 Tax=Solemya velesiana gill symbiont TaxID=1918948 RepID=A0A1T2KWC2_9GAMM|nr:M14 family metallopeptidase [Solemya velesiana gill symbiont]OOZ37135.1 peptidase M14 [Solemya velesiana gill symbiont]